jgi:hypothetical protein
MLDRDETLSASEVKSRLQSGAIDITERSGPFLGTSESDKTPIPNGTGDDIFSGAGLIQADASPPLPVELASLTASVNGNAPVLSWRTRSEDDNAGFEVQRKTASATDWAKIGFVDSKAEGGTINELHSYRFEDTDVPFAADRLKYRLRQVDLDGTETLTDPVEVERTVDRLELRRTYPNPARTQATVQFMVPERQDVSLELRDVLGRQVRTIEQRVLEGRQEMKISLSGLPSGTYFLRLQAGGQAETKKVTVVR